MKILVLSDSHSGLGFMRLCIDKVRPDAIIHLGDYYDDAVTIHEEYPNIPMHQVPGNCDRYRCPQWVSEILIQPIGGVRFYMTHGHRHGVKMSTGPLIRAAREAACDAVLYGHTHCKECVYEDGLWILNPGSCGSYGGTAGLIEIDKGKILRCEIVDAGDLDAMC